MASRTEMPYKPSAIEQAADPEDLKVIRDLFGSRAQIIINSLLAFDAFFAWYKYKIKTLYDTTVFTCLVKVRQILSLKPTPAALRP